MRQAYDEQCASEPWPDGRADVPLTTGDVFRWLEVEGLFPRSAKRHIIESAPTRPKKAHPKPDETAKAEQRTEEYCRACGLHYSRHPTREPQEQLGVPTATTTITTSTSIGTGTGTAADAVVVKAEPTTTVLPLPPPPMATAPAQVCPRFNGTAGQGGLDLPVVDVNRLLAFSTSRQQQQQQQHEHGREAESQTACGGVCPTLFCSAPCGGSAGAGALDSAAGARELLTASAPEVVLAVRDLAARWRMDRLRADGASSYSTVALRNEPREQTEDGLALAPFAMLALAVRSFTRMLMRSGLEELRRDEAGVRASTLGSSNNTKARSSCRGGAALGEGAGGGRRLLTPSHVARGVVHDARSVAGCGALLLAVAPVGMSLPSMSGGGGGGLRTGRR